MEDFKTSSYKNPRTSYEHPRKKSHTSVFKILMQGPGEGGFNRISTRSSQKDLSDHDLEDLTRTFSRASHKDLHKIVQRLLRGCH